MITNLKDSPQFLAETLSLIENSFGYHEPHKFLNDFGPLFSEENLQNCNILIGENQEVLAHVGSKTRQILLNETSFNITMLGGIAVSDKNRGSGLFKKLLTKVIADNKTLTTFFVLWSDLEKLYNKFGFHLCGGQFESNSAKTSNRLFVKTKFSALDADEKKDMDALYQNSFNTNYLSLSRDSKIWDEVQSVSSADLYIKRDHKKIIEYFFMNKGQDLTDVIYEYGTSKELIPFLNEISSYGKLWTGHNFLGSDNAQYQFFLSPGNEELFNKFIESYTDGKFKIRGYNIDKNEIFVDFDEETLSFEIGDFLKGVFGPESYEELNTKPIFISGIDSI